MIFYFTPDTTIEGLHAITKPNDEDALFIYTKEHWQKTTLCFPSQRTAKYVKREG
ncbi:hypothetical protein BN2127_JRS3_01676 [Bacillus safensis]|nr:hypothetical protein BN2127_JRS3_01676 [Bacillus safensis]